MLLSGLDAWHARELLTNITIICVSPCAKPSAALSLPPINPSQPGARESYAPGLY
jgi:hypothetical protein